MAFLQGDGAVEMSAVLNAEGRRRSYKGRKGEGPPCLHTAQRRREVHLIS